MQFFNDYHINNLNKISRTVNYFISNNNSVSRKCYTAGIFFIYFYSNNCVSRVEQLNYEISNFCIMALLDCTFYSYGVLYEFPFINPYTSGLKYLNVLKVKNLAAAELNQFLYLSFNPLSSNRIMQFLNNLTTAFIYSYKLFNSYFTH